MTTAASLGRLLAALTLLAALGAPSPGPSISVSGARHPRLDPILEARARMQTGRSTVIVRAADAAAASLIRERLTRLGGVLRRPLPIIDGYAADVPNTALRILGRDPHVQHVALDRAAVGTMERTSATVGATALRQQSGYDGAGVGVAIIDSGITPWHDDLTDAAGVAQRVDRFVDFVNARLTAYDDYGHGTHVAGVIAGNGFDSNGARAGIAPGARLIALKVLDASGKGRISDVIAALDYVIAEREALNIRVVNLSVATGVYESYNADPLTLAARRVVEAGIVVVAAAGNHGSSPAGRTQYAGITAPGNAPWVLTVGASSHGRTSAREDDTVAAFSSRGPAAIDYVAKPDLVAPGVGIESLSDPASAFYTTKARYLLSGAVPTSFLPYLSQSGTSMAAPVVTGTIALMMQANPALTPNQIKAILQYTAQPYAAYNALTQGAGFLNAKGAVSLAQFLASPATTTYPSSAEWGGRLLWGNYLVQGGRLTAAANAWSPDVVWGAAVTPSGENVAWGVICSSRECDGSTSAWKVWGATCSDASCTTVVWGDANTRNVVWGTICDGANCRRQWNSGLLRGGDDSDTVAWRGADERWTVASTSGCPDPSCNPPVRLPAPIAR